MKGTNVQDKPQTGIWRRVTIVPTIVVFVGGVFVYLLLGTPMAGTIVDRA